MIASFLVDVPAMISNLFLQFQYYHLTLFFTFKGCLLNERLSVGMRSSIWCMSVIRVIEIPGASKLVMKKLEMDYKATVHCSLSVTVNR